MYFDEHILSKVAAYCPYSSLGNLLFLFPKSLRNLHDYLDVTGNRISQFYYSALIYQYNRVIYRNGYSNLLKLIGSTEEERIHNFAKYAGDTIVTLNPIPEKEWLFSRYPKTSVQYCIKTRKPWTIPEYNKIIMKDCEASVKYLIYFNKTWDQFPGITWNEIIAFEESIIDSFNEFYSYIRYVSSHRFTPEFGHNDQTERRIAAEPRRSIEYARVVLKKRWTELSEYFLEETLSFERIIARTPDLSYRYSIAILRKRWIDCPEYSLEESKSFEAIISESPEYATRYAINVIWNRWTDPNVEDTILKNQRWAYKYAKNINDQQLRDNVLELLFDPELLYKFARIRMDRLVDSSGNIYIEKEWLISRDPAMSAQYAINCMDTPWSKVGFPEYEEIIHEDRESADLYYLIFQK